MSCEHTLRVFDHELEALKQEVVNLSHQVCTELEEALHALLTADHKAAAHVIAADHQIDQLKDSIHSHTTRTLARQQAMASDLRAILAAAHIALHLERIGDYAKNTAKRTRRLSQPINPALAIQF